MEHRIFIAINLPEGIRQKLAEYQEKWPDLPARWTKPENLHITLVFIGYTDEKEVLAVIPDVIVRHKSFAITLDRISYGPPKMIPPRMIWASGSLPKEFLELKQDLEKELSQKIKFVPEKRGAALHITLARIKEWEWRRIEPEERPEIEENMDLSFEVKSIELMESQLKRDGPDYKILESYNLT